jgi:hypothetical protein
MIHTGAQFCKNLSFLISLCIFRDLPQQKIPRELCVAEIPLYFYVPMLPWKDFLMRQIKKIQKHEEERDRSGKFKEKQEGKNGGKKKKRFFVYVDAPIHNCSPSVGNALGQKHFTKTRRKDWKKAKEEIFRYVEVPILVCSPLVGNGRV